MVKYQILDILEIFLTTQLIYPEERFMSEVQSLQDSR